MGKLKKKKVRFIRCIEGKSDGNDLFEDWNVRVWLVMVINSIVVCIKGKRSNFKGGEDLN